MRYVLHTHLLLFLLVQVLGVAFLLRRVLQRKQVEMLSPAGLSTRLSLVPLSCCVIERRAGFPP